MLCIQGINPSMKRPISKQSIGLLGSPKYVMRSLPICSFLLVSAVERRGWKPSKSLGGGGCRAILAGSLSQHSNYHLKTLKICHGVPELKPVKHYCQVHNTIKLKHMRIIGSMIPERKERTHLDMIIKLVINKKFYRNIERCHNHAISQHVNVIKLHRAKRQIWNLRAYLIHVNFKNP